MRTKREVLSEILYQAEQAGEQAALDFFGQMLEEVIEAGTEDEPSIFEVTDDGHVILLEQAVFKVPSPQTGEA